MEAGWAAGSRIPGLWFSSSGELLRNASVPAPLAWSTSPSTRSCAVSGGSLSLQLTHSMLRAAFGGRQLCVLENQTRKMLAGPFLATVSLLCVVR